MAYRFMSMTEVYKLRYLYGPLPGTLPGHDFDLRGKVSSAEAQGRRSPIPGQAERCLDDANAHSGRACVGCQVCAQECPTDAIKIESGVKVRICTAWTCLSCHQKLVGSRWMPIRVPRQRNPENALGRRSRLARGRTQSRLAKLAFLAGRAQGRPARPLSGRLPRGHQRRPVRQPDRAGTLR